MEGRPRRFDSEVIARDRVKEWGSRIRKNYLESLRCDGAVHNPIAESYLILAQRDYSSATRTLTDVEIGIFDEVFLDKYAIEGVNMNNMISTLQMECKNMAEKEKLARKVGGGSAAKRFVLWKGLGF